MLKIMTRFFFSDMMSLDEFNAILNVKYGIKVKYISNFIFFCYKTSFFNQFNLMT